MWVRKILRTRKNFNYAKLHLSKIYFLKIAVFYKFACKPNNRDLNWDWISNILITSNILLKLKKMILLSFLILKSLESIIVFLLQFIVRQHLMVISIILKALYFRCIGLTSYLSYYLKSLIYVPVLKFSIYVPVLKFSTKK